MINWLFPMYANAIFLCNDIMAFIVNDVCQRREAAVRGGKSLQSLVIVSHSYQSNQGRYAVFQGR